MPRAELAEAPPALRHWLREAARRTPEAHALRAPGAQLSYADLLAQTEALAARLRAAGLVGGDRVAIAASRSAHTIVCILAAVDAGLAYVPLDLSYPAARLQTMLRDAMPRIVLGEPPALADLREAVGDFPTLDQPASGGLPPHGALADLAYVLFTSGSTGRPKGVAMGALPLRHLVQWHALHPRLGLAARTLQFASLSFDVHFQEIFSTLACGGTLVMLAEEERLDPALLLGAIERLGVERIFVPFVVLQALADAARGGAPGALRDVISAGEQIRVTPAIRALLARVPGAELHNHYGPTECHVVTAFELRGEPAAWPEIPPIGTALPHVRLALRPAEGHTGDDASTGELLIGGETLAHGYIGQPERTAERFVDGIAGLPGRWYLTGDLAHRDANGVYSYRGRIDQQVKVRGFRIELGEIEAVIAAHPAVRQVAVIDREDEPGDKRIVAYLVADAPGTTLEPVRDLLRARLPEYMVPSRFVFIAALPTTPNGKLDRRALPVPAEPRSATPPEASAPRSPTEQRVERAMAAVLGIATLGARDDFFSLGGASLQAGRLVSLLSTELGLRITLRHLFENPTVEKLARLVDGMRLGAAAMSSLSCIRPGSGPTPVFFIHDGFGETLVYGQVARLLPAELPVYVLYPLAADGVQMVHTRIADMAAHYLAAIRTVQAHGPYLLAGLCAGGVIAFEMAQQLQRQGETIGMLALMDANDVAARRRSGRHAGQLARAAARTLRQAVSIGQPLRTAAALFGFVRTLGGIVAQQVVFRRVQGLGRLKARALRLCLDQGIRPPRFVRDVSVDQIYAAAEADHVVSGPLQGDMLLFLASQGDGNAEDEPYRNLYLDPLLGWGPRVSGQVRCVVSGGGHYSMFQEPHVGEMAREMQQPIDVALRRTVF